MNTIYQRDLYSFPWWVDTVKICTQYWSNYLLVALAFPSIQTRCIVYGLVKSKWHFSLRVMIYHWWLCCQPIWFNVTELQCWKVCHRTIIYMSSHSTLTSTSLTKSKMPVHQNLIYQSRSTTNPDCYSRANLWFSSLTWPHAKLTQCCLTNKVSSKYRKHSSIWINYKLSTFTFSVIHMSRARWHRTS